MSPCLSDLRDAIYEEFSMSKYVSSSERLDAIVNELAKMRQMTFVLDSLSNYFCGGHYEPRNDDEANIARQIIKELSKLPSNPSVIRKPRWMEGDGKIELEVNQSGRLQLRENTAAKSTSEWPYEEWSLL